MDFVNQSRLDQTRRVRYTEGVRLMGQNEHHSDTRAVSENSGVIGVSACHPRPFGPKMRGVAARSGRKHAPRGIKRARLSNVNAELVDKLETEAAARDMSRAALGNVVLALGLQALRGLDRTQTQIDLEDVAMTL